MERKMRVNTALYIRMQSQMVNFMLDVDLMASVSHKIYLADLGHATAASGRKNCQQHGNYSCGTFEFFSIPIILLTY